MIRTILVDDERLNIELMVSDLTKYCPDIQIIATADNVPDAIENIIKLKPDLLFLDIQIHNQTAFDILSAINNGEIYTILVTAYDHYGVAAVKHSVIDYILKPVQVPELMNAVNKVKTQISKQQSTTIANTSTVDFISIPHKEHVLLVKFSDIVHLESHGNYTEITSSQHTKYTSSKAIKEFETMLPSNSFLRVHQSHIINLQYLTKYIRSKNGSLELSNGKIIPISSTHKKEVSLRLGFKS